MKDEMIEKNVEVKPIILKDEEGREFILEFNRASIKYAEQRGFDLEDLSKFPMTKVPELFHYAFIMHHKGVTKDRTDKLFDNIGQLPDGFIERLIKLYSIPFETLTGEGKKGVVSVEM